MLYLVYQINFQVGNKKFANKSKKKFYEKVVCEDFILLYNFKNISQLPAFERGILHSTSHKFVCDEFSLLQSCSAIFLASGERPIKRKAHKSIAHFAIRKDNILGLKVTLRKNALFTLLDKLLIFVVPTFLSDLQGSMKTLVSLQKTKKQRKSSVVKLSQLRETFDRKASLREAITFGNKEWFCFAANFSSEKLSRSEQSLAHLGKTKSRAPRLFRDFSEKQEIEKSKNVVITYKDATCFPETAYLLMFFNSSKGFSFDCSFLLPTLNYKPNLRSVESKLLDANLKKNDNKQLNDFLSLPIKKGKNKCLVKNQFISAFQYPLSIF